MSAQFFSCVFYQKLLFLLVAPPGSILPVTYNDLTNDIVATKIRLSWPKMVALEDSACGSRRIIDLRSELSEGFVAVRPFTILT
jgi:hypothetical protein